DRWGGGRVTFWVFVGMIASVLLVIWSLQTQFFIMFFLGFMLMFFFTGVGNASTFQMIPVIMRKEIGRIFAGQSEDKQRHQAERERSEEHTSELQSRFDLVCRLLLEKKNKVSHRNRACNA